MIAVSNEFKKAIKEPERQIKGYVEILYDIPSIEITPTTNMISTYTNITEVSNGNRVSNNYGTLDYLPLDGSVLVMDTLSNENSGFISDELSGNISGGTVTLTFSETTIKGITAYYEDNLPENASYTLSDGTTGYFDGEEIQQAIFDEEKTITSITISYDLWRYDDRKIRINQIDLGISQIYKDQDLIEFTVDEEVDKLVLETPINETNITLNNMSDLFNPLNSTGIVPYLSENTLIKPYIGILTENLGVEYIKMGEFYFDSYTNNSDSTTTLTGKNLIKKLDSETLKTSENHEFFSSSMNESMFHNFMENYSYQIENDNWRTIMTMYWKDNNLLKFLKDMAFYQDNLLYADRSSIIKLKKQDEELKDNLSKTELINDVEFKYIDKINTVKVKRPYQVSEASVSNRTIIDETVVLSKSPEVFVFATNAPNMFNATVTQSGGTSASIIDIGLYMAFIEVTGEIGDNVQIILKSTLNNDENTLEYTLQKEQRDKIITLEFDSAINVFARSVYGYLNNSDILDRTPSYEMRFEYNGDPSLEAGDYINVETPYGYKPLFIQKQSLKFDGGLEGSIEGVE